MPEWIENIVIPWILPPLLGGLSGLLGGYFFPRWLQGHKFKLDQRLLEHQNHLSWQEKIFERELSAADALISTIAAITPAYNQPYMEHYEACEALASDLTRTESRLAELLRVHSIGLSDEIRDELKSLKLKAAKNKFFEPEGPLESPPKFAMEAASEILDSFNQIEAMLFDNVKRRYRRVSV